MSTEHTRRPRLLALGLVALAACLLLGMTVFGTDLGRPDGKDSNVAAPNPWDGADYVNSGTLGDTDNDGEVSATETSALETTQVSVESVRDVLAPTKGGDTVLLTPGGDDWWTFVASQAPALGMVESPTPDDVDWYAYTEGRAFKSASAANDYYQAIHVAFADYETASLWVRGLAADGHGAGALFSLRDRVVTITPAWVDISTEPYPDVDEDALSRIDAKVGLWQIDFAEQAENRAREASDHVGYANFWNATGLTGTWTATSPRPDVAWVGTLDGFDPNRVDVAAAVSHINTSMFACAQDRECDGDNGISEAIGDMYLLDGDGAGAGEELLAPTETPDDLALALILNDSFRGMVNESYSLTGVPKTEYIVTEDGTLTLRFDFTLPEASTALDTEPS